MQIPEGMDQVDGRDITHALLIALLQQHHHGAAELEIAGLQAAMGDEAGRLFAFALERGRDDRHALITVVPVGRDADGLH
jgi:hypothetical protein